MDFITFVLLVFSLLSINILVYIIFVKWLIKTENSGIKFLFINIFKDAAWVIFWILKLDRERSGYLLLGGLFLFFSGILYYKVIKAINGSNDY